MKKETLAERLERLKGTVMHQEEKIKIDFAIQLKKIMNEMDLNGKSLSKKMNVSEPYISAILRGNKNLTLKTILKIVTYLGCDFEFKIKPKNLTDCEKFSDKQHELIEKLSKCVVELLGGFDEQKKRNDTFEHCKDLLL